jgi:hypothetical protein
LAVVAWHHQYIEGKTTMNQQRGGGRWMGSTSTSSRGVLSSILSFALGVLFTNVYSFMQQIDLSPDVSIDASR